MRVHVISEFLASENRKRNCLRIRTQMGHEVNTCRADCRVHLPRSECNSVLRSMRQSLFPSAWEDLDCLLGAQISLTFVRVVLHFDPDFLTCLITVPISAVAKFGLRTLRTTAMYPKLPTSGRQSWTMYGFIRSIPRHKTCLAGATR